MISRKTINQNKIKSTKQLNFTYNYIAIPYKITKNIKYNFLNYNIII